VKRPHIHDAFWGRGAGLRVASTFRLPDSLHRRRFTKAAIGVRGVIAGRDNDAPVNTPTCRQLTHSTVTAGSPRDASSDMPKR
jgi:hypothetical protein